MPLFVSGVDAAVRALAKLHQQKLKLEAQGAAAEQELASLRSVSGEQVLDELLDASTKRGSARRRIADLEADIQDLSIAKRALLGRIRAAMLAVGHARAAEIRTKVRKLTAERDRHLEERNRMKADLEAFAETTFVAQDASYMMPTAFMEGILPDMPAPKISLATRLAMEIQRLEAEAKRIEEAATQEAAGGRSAGETLEKLLEGAGHPLAPSEAEIRAWFSRAVARADADWSRNQAHWAPAPGRGPTRFNLVWNGAGEIDEPQSRGDNTHFARVLPSDWPAHLPRVVVG